MSLRAVPSDREVRTRLSASRSVDLETRYVIACVVARVAEGMWEEINAIRWTAWYYSIVLNACRVTSMADTGTDAVKHVLLLCISFFMRIGCTLFTCDMYMCHLRHINDSVLSSLKMEGIRLLFFLQTYFDIRQYIKCISSSLRITKDYHCWWQVATEW
jgi:hypothetical protein